MLRLRYSVEQWLQIYTVIIVSATVGALSISTLQGRSLLYKPFLKFSDLTVYLEKAKHPIGNAEAIVSKPPQLNYPAPGVLVYSAVANLPGDPLSWFFSIILLVAVVSAWKFEKFLARAHIKPWTRWTFAVATLVTSYPLWFELDRANIEGVMWIFVIVAMLLFGRQKFMLSAALLAVAGAIKPFPLVILAIFLAHALYKEIIVSVAIWAAVTLSAFLLTSGSFGKAAHHYQAGTQSYQGSIAVGYKAFDLNYDHSLFAVIKQVYHAAFALQTQQRLNNIYLPYLGVAALGAFACWFILRRRPVLNQILGIFIFMVILPPSNYDYTLMNLYVPFAFFISYLVLDVGRNSDLVPGKLIGGLLFCFSIIFTSQTFIHFHETGFGGQIKLLALLGALAISLLFPMYSPSWDGVFARERRVSTGLVAQ